MAVLFLLSVALLATPGLSVPLRSPEPLRRVPEELCRDQPNFFRIATADNCIKYYQCYSGRAYLMLCPDFTWFNEDQQICDDENSPPVGCEVAQPPITTPPPETEEETPEQPEVPEEQPEEEVEQPEEEDEGSGEAGGKPEGTEEPKVEPEEPQESEDDPKNETNEEEIQPPIEELLPTSESEELSTNEPEAEVDAEEPNEPNEESQTNEPDLETEESNLEDTLPTEVLQVSEEEGSGDLTTAEEITEEGSGFGLLPTLQRRLGKSEEETPVEVMIVHSSESSEAFPEDHGLDFELDGLILLKASARDHVVYEIPSIESVFVLPEHDK